MSQIDGSDRAYYLGKLKKEVDTNRVEEVLDGSKDLQME